MQLPDALRPWREWLEWFAPEHLPLFADLLGRLNPLLGPLTGRLRGGLAEPDGLGDLQRRGHYERLLSSEWLLAEEMPDEFLRRATTGEHLFLAPQYRARRANRLIVVLFDAGPMQLGAPRLVHLALLILLARRAREAGAELRWGIAQDAPHLHALDGVPALGQLLKARTWQLFEDHHWQAWCGWLAQQSLAVGECWLVGQRLPATDNSLCSHRVQVQRSLDRHELTFDLQAQQPRRVTLPVPDSASASALLQGHFAQQAVAAPGAPLKSDQVPRVSLALPPLLSASGNHVALRLLDEPGVVIIKLPTPEQKKSLEVRRSKWHNGRSLLGLTFISRNVGALLSGGEKLWFWNIPGMDPLDKPARDHLQLTPGTRSLLPTAWLRDNAQGGLLVLDPLGRLVFWATRANGTMHRPELRQRLFKDAVLGMAQVGWGIAAYIRNNDGRLFAHAVGSTANELNCETIGNADGVSQVLFAATPQWRHQFGGCALGSIENDGEVWQIRPAISGSAPAAQIRLARGWKAVGLLLDHGHYGLVVLGPEAHNVVFYRDGEQQVLFTTSARIDRVSFCPMSGLVAALTRSRELLVYAVATRTLRLQVFCNQSTQAEDASEHKESADAGT